MIKTPDAYVISIFHLEVRLHSHCGRVGASRAPLLQLRACVIFTAQVIAIQLRGEPAVCEREKTDGRAIVLSLSNPG